jgi:hypothetical protein
MDIWGTELLWNVVWSWCQVKCFSDYHRKRSLRWYSININCRPTVILWGLVNEYISEFKGEMPLLLLQVEPLNRRKHRYTLLVAHDYSCFCFGFFFADVKDIIVFISISRLMSDKLWKLKT